MSRLLIFFLFLSAIVCAGQRVFSQDPSRGHLGFDRRLNALEDDIRRLGSLKPIATPDLVGSVNKRMEQYGKICERDDGESTQSQRLALLRLSIRFHSFCSKTLRELPEVQVGRFSHAQPLIDEVWRKSGRRGWAPDNVSLADLTVDPATLKQIEALQKVDAYRSQIDTAREVYEEVYYHLPRFVIVPVAMKFFDLDHVGEAEAFNDLVKEEAIDHSSRHFLQGRMKESLQFSRHSSASASSTKR